MRVYSVSDGLKYPQLFTVFQDSRGLLWIGSSYGLGRYDGGEFVNLTSRDGLPHDSVYTIGEAADGSIWVLTQEGPARVEALAGPFGAPVVAPEPALPRMQTDRELLAAGGGSVWLTDGESLLRTRGGTVTRWNVSPGTGTGALVAFGPAGSESVWACTAGRVMRWHAGGSADSFTVPEGGGRVTAVVPIDGGVLLLQKHGIARLEGERFVPDPGWRLPPDLNPSGAVARGAELIVYTPARGVVLLRRGAEPHFITTSEGLPSDTVDHAMVDRDGVVWLATADGLVKIFDFAMRSYPTRLPEIGAMVLAFARETTGGMWVGHSSGATLVAATGLQRVDPDRGRPVDPAVWALLSLPGGGVLAGTTHGLVEISRDGARPFPDLPEAGRDPVYALSRDRDGRIWASAQHGLVRFRWDDRLRRPTDIEAFTTVGGESLGEARGVASEADGTVWIGTDGRGLLRWNQGELHRLDKVDGLPSSVCRVVLADAAGVLVGTDRGLYRLNGGRAAPVEAVNRELHDLYIVAMIADGAAFWLATTYEVLRIEHGQVSERLDQATGLIGATTTAENCLAIDDHRRLWVGMAGGVTIVDLTAPRRPPPPPDVLILAATDVDERTVVAGERLAFPVKALSFAFSSPTFLAEERTRFVWRLLGHDERWSEPNRQSSVRFTNLLPGRYEFQVQAIATSGQRSVRPASFAFSVVVPWRLGTLAVLGVVAVVTGTAATIAHWRTRTIRRRNTELERLASKRTEQLAEANRRLERLASVDGLTGVANYRVFHDHFGREWLRALREATPLSLIMIDIDFFKSYNDALGHQQGDECLRRVAAAIAVHASRPADLAARYGGEEFVVLLVATPEDGAETVAEKIRASVEALAIPHPASTAADVVTISLGVATRRPGPGRDAEELLTTADRALYRAKREGRNRVVAATVL